MTSLNSALCWSLMPPGGLLGGLLIDSVGLTPALVAVGLGYFLATMLPVVRPAFRDFDRPSPGGVDTRQPACTAA